MNRPRYQPADLSRLRTYSVGRRPHKVSTAALAGLPEPGTSAADLFASLPDVLGVREFRATVDAMAAAIRDGRPVVLAMGAHVVKVGCTPIVVDLIRRGIVSAVACNGAFAIHDMELATVGATSEEVADTIRDGSFGMVSETLDFFTRAAARADERQIGFGEAVGGLLVEANPPGLAHSVLAAAYQASIPATLHVALGTDTVHASGVMDGARIGAASLRDFRLICSVVGDLGAASADGPGGVWLNVGSAVVMPEVFLKAVSVARNLGANLDAMTTANFDMLRHYRPKVNVVTRPVTPGRGHEVIGHHEILLPLLRAALLERLAGPGAVP
jgi:hypothetical protein